MSRTTRVIAVDPEQPDPAAIADAAAVLRAGGLVAFATETVYGLGADATSPEAVARIFEAKGRPATNPLIVHVDSIAMAQSCAADWPSRADALAKQWWPGPLTLVCRRSAIVPDLVTAGQDTVGLRMPGTAVALALIRSLGRPLAAPSANRSTGLSATLAGHVLKDLDGRIDLMLDSGPTQVGLESTVLDVTGEAARILRPGPISEQDLTRATGLTVRPADPEPFDDDAPQPSPGRMRVHYAPRTPAYWVEPDRIGRPEAQGKRALVVFGEHDLSPTPEIGRRIDLKTPEEAAGLLYAVLHDLDEQGFDAILIVPPPDRPEWQAIRDRLRRATAGRG